MTPEKRTPTPPANGDTSLLLPGRGELVLVVDDDVTLLQTLARMLQSLGFQVVTASDGEAALVVIESLRTPIDAVLTDVVMPRLGGPELVERLAHRGLHPAVVYMSGYEDAARLKRVLETPSMTPLLHKPFTLHALVVVLRNLLDRRRSSRSEG